MPFPSASTRLSWFPLLTLLGLMLVVSAYGADGTIEPTTGAAAVAVASAASDRDQAAALAATGQFEELKLLLERRVMLQSATATDWFDLAAAYAHLGEWTTTGQLLDYIDSELNPPAELKPWIARYRQLIAEASPAPRSRNWSASLALLHGAETNVNAAPAVSSLTLMQGGLPVTLELDSRFQPRSGQSNLLEMRGETRLPQGRDDLLLAGDLIQRLVQADSADNTRQLQLLGGVRRELGIGQLSATAAYQQADWGGATLYRGMRAQFGLETDWSGCRLLAAAEGELRRFPIESSLNGQALGVDGGLGCPLANGGRWQLILRTVRDQPEQSDRAGGGQTRQELDFALQHALPHGARIDLTAVLALVRDDQAYSPLFGDTVRRIDRNSLRAEYIYPVGDGFEALLRLERLQQISNLDLFLLRNNSFHVGLRKIF